MIKITPMSNIERESMLKLVTSNDHTKRLIAMLSLKLADLEQYVLELDDKFNKLSESVKT